MPDRQFADIVGGIYEAALDETSWSQVLCATAEFCGAENAALVVVDSRSDSSTVVTPRADPDIVAAYTRSWWLHDPTARATASTPIGQLTTLSDTGREMFLDSPFHNEFWRRSGLGAERIATNLIVGDRMFSSLVLQTSVQRDEISESMFERFSLLVPHFLGAVRLSARLLRMEIEGMVEGSAQAEDCAGIIVLDAAARVMFADAAAEALLIDGVELQTVGGSLRLARAYSDALLLGAVAACAASGPRLLADHPIQIPCGATDAPLVAEIVPYRGRIARKMAMAAGSSAPAAVMILRDPAKRRNGRIAMLRERYGLTPAEAALALEMLAGDGRAAAAARCGISINTARTHLMRIFGKMGVSRQTELIRLLLD